MNLFPYPVQRNRLLKFIQNKKSENWEKKENYVPEKCYEYPERNHYIFINKL